MTWHSHFPLSRELETWLGKPTPKQTFFRKMIFWMHYFWMRSKLMKAIKFLCFYKHLPCQRLRNTPSGNWTTNCIMKCFFWQLFALSTLLFSVSIENFGFTVSTPFFLKKKNVSLNCEMSEMHVNHSRVVVDLEKILQRVSAEN